MVATELKESINNFIPNEYNNNMNENTNNKIDVLYNDSCPVCRREIEIYKSRSNGINFKDSSLMEDKYNRRMHAYKDGVEYIGAEAFLVVWEKTNGFKWLTYFLKNKFFIFIMNLIYEPIAFYLYRMHWRRKNKEN